MDSKGFEKSSIRLYIMIFKGPERVQTYWADLPSRIDAVYRVPELDQPWATGNLRFFSGSQYWEYAGKNLVPGFPKPLSALGLKK